MPNLKARAFKDKVFPSESLHFENLQPAARSRENYFKNESPNASIWEPLCNFW